MPLAQFRAHVSGGAASVGHTGAGTQAAIS